MTVDDVPTTPESSTRASRPAKAVLLTAAVLLILVAAFAMRWTFQVGFIFSDDMPQFQLAKLLALGEPNLKWALFATYGRYGLGVLSAPFFSVLGISQTTSTLIIILLSLLHIGLVIGFARMLSGCSKSGLIAGFLAAFLPLYIICATLFLPDTPMVLLNTLYAFILWRIFRPTDTPLAVKPWVTALLGCFAYMMLFFKESGFLEIGFLTVFMLTWNLVLKRLTWQSFLLHGVCFLAGVLAVWTIESLVYAVVLDDPLIRWTYRNMANTQSVETSETRYQGFWPKIATWISQLAQQDKSLPVLLAVTLVTGFLVQNRWSKLQQAHKQVLLFLLLWQLSALIPLLISLPLTASFQPRRLLPLLGPAVIFLAVSWRYLAVNFRIKAVGFCLATGLIISMLFSYYPYLFLSDCSKGGGGPRWSKYLGLYRNLPVYHKCKYQPYYADLGNWISQNKIGSKEPLYSDAKTLHAISASNRFIQKHCSPSFKARLSKTDPDYHTFGERDCNLIDLMEHPIRPDQSGYVILQSKLAQKLPNETKAILQQPPGHWMRVYHQASPRQKITVSVYRIDPPKGI